MRKYALSPKGRRLHRLLGLVFGTYLVAAALSGVVHNVIALNFPHGGMMPPPTALMLSSAGITPAEAMQAAGQAAGGAIAQAVNLRSVKGNLFYQLVLPGKAAPVYVDASSGTVSATADTAYAAEIATQMAPKKQVALTAYLTAFDGEYLEMFHTLPVYRFDATGDDSFRVYVSTATGGITYATTDARQALAAVFRALHLLTFIGNDAVRLWLLIFLAAGGLATAGFGLFMVWARQAGRRGKA